MSEAIYCDSLFQYKRVKTIEVPVGDLSIGGSSPIRVQSMTTTNTKDTEASVEQSVRIIEAGGELVRLTTPGRVEAENLKNIWEGLRAQGFTAPLVADIHFNPAAAETAARYVEKIRINPGNFTGELKTFDMSADNISDADWMSLVVEKLRPLVDVCKQYETSVRIGVNHGSLSDRIMAKYGDTPLGMVESCLEYIRAFRQLDFNDLVLSIKASNTRVMVQTVRLLMSRMRAEGFAYPLHLGVTEAGSDAEGRIKSAAGIGALLVDGIGDTVRVSLTEAPEAEIPVAQRLVDYVVAKGNHDAIEEQDASSYSPYEYSKRTTHKVMDIGGNANPVVIADGTGRKSGQQCDADFIFTNDKSVAEASSASVSDMPELYNNIAGCRPMLTVANIDSCQGEAFVRLTLPELTDDVVAKLRQRDNLVIVAQPLTTNPTAELRALVLKLNACAVGAPVVAWLRYDTADISSFQLYSAVDTGLLFIDGLIDGLMLSDYSIEQPEIVATALGIMQATRVRFSKTEFISCPGCGRTLYDIQHATRMIKARMGHLKGLKIGVMGCIVNGIGEMADADYGYIGAGPGKISLYRGKELIKKAILENDALQELENIIRNDGLWVEP